MGAHADLTAEAAVRALLGRDVARVSPLGGAYRVRLDGGTEVVAKRHAAVGALNAEVAGLRWLSPDTDGCPRVPGVLAFDDQWLVMEVVPAGRPSRDTAEGFGRELARLHGLGATAPGSAPPGGPVDAWIGLAPMRNVPGTRWGEWYVEHRVLPYLRKAVDLGVLHDPAPIEAVCGRIGQLAGPDEPPARLHGDLWSGNVLWSDRVWLIDPAAHGGHRETDLAMLALFGCPHLERILSAYDESAPLADGWRERVALHQLFPLLVHTVLFGGGYGAQAVASARSLA
ncbi:fructosamine kinase family protein [Actinophytocola oryzae]|uniref:Fructosamine-3-kinase n=1 Tax=Actinophytocola oryzae TaxID=502181 RepID=A0A4R7UR93_9PSEU|nr:fructosamine kinase family protein [Actinophytocola oryzae]TDV37572.1 fructosamine-3-kinase [Actinophytocola oryzae]